MDRNTYLAELRNCLGALPLEEQNEAMEYFTDFFEDAENDEKVIEELGEPEKLAEEIKAQFAWVPAKIDTAVETGKKKSGDESSGKEGAAGFKPKRNRTGSGHSSSFRSQGLYYEFEADKVKNLELSLGAAEIVMVSGAKWSVETRLIEPVSFKCELTEKGTLVIDNRVRLPNLSFWQHEDRHSAPRILMTVPEGASLSILKIALGAGSFVAKNTSLSCKVACIDVSAGNLELGYVRGGSWTIHCGMGNINITGTATGTNNIDCGMGKINMDLNGNPEEYSFAGRTGLGAISFNNKSKGGVGTIECRERLENHLSVNCGMGMVSIHMTK